MSACLHMLTCAYLCATCERVYEFTPMSSTYVCHLCAYLYLPLCTLSATYKYPSKYLPVST